jgi:GNAT superfamily N-acetyltransferase
MTEFRVRTGHPEELSRVRTTYAAWGYTACAEPNDLVFLAERDGELIGLVRRTQEYDTLMLRGMHVAPAAQGQGVGTRLLHVFVAELAGRECYCIPYAHLVDFYGRKGFEVVSPDDSPSSLAERLAGHRKDGLDVVIMRRPPSGRPPA